jgi:hypothetical protein
MGLAEPTRAEVVAWGVAEFGTVLFLFLSVLLERLKHERLFALRTKSDRTLFASLGVWFAACTVSAIVGIARGNPWDYLLGDFYRFGSLPIIFGSMYFAVKDRAGVHKLLRGFVAVYGIMVALDLVRFNTYAYIAEERLTTETAHQAGMIAVAVIYLMLFDPQSWVRRCSVAILLLTTVLLFRAQMLTPILTSLLAMALFFIFSRKFAVFLGAAVAAGFLIVASFYSLSVSSAVPSYIGDKLISAQDSMGPLESVEVLSGIRLGEIISIGEEFSNHPSSLAFGTGEGSLISPDPIADPSLPISRYEEEKHYVHAGLFDALYHNGAIGVGAFLAFLLHTFRRAARLHKNGDPFGLLVLVTLMVTVLLLMYDLPFESAIPVLGLCFSGISIMKSDSKRVLTAIVTTSFAFDV